MKLRAIILTLIATIALIILGSSRVLAEEIKVGRDVINAEITKDGAINVTEEINFDISGKYNGVYKDISFDKAGHISILSVEEVKETTINYAKVNSASNGQKGVYTLETSNKRVRIKIYSPSRDERKTFRIQYRIDDAVKKYMDIGEFYWKFIGKENETTIGTLEINLTLPEGAKRDQIKAFGHGPLDGNWKITDDRTIRFVVANLSSGKYVEVRTLFPQELLPMAKTSMNENKLQQILKEEEIYTQVKAVSDRRFQIILTILRYIAVIISIFNILLIPYILVKFKKQEEQWQVGRHDIQNYDPTMLAYNARRYLYNHNLLAAILELVRKGYFAIEAMEEWVQGNKYQKKNFQNYKITKLKEKDEKLLGHEKYLMHWLIDVIGDGSTVTLEKIKRYGESRPADFRRQFALWNGEVKLQADKSNLIDRNADMLKGVIIILEVLLMVASAVFIGLVHMYGVLSLVTSVAAFTAALFINVRTQEGNLQYILWKEMQDRLRTCRQADIDQWAQNPSQLELYTIYAISMDLRESMAVKLEPYIASGSYNGFFNMMIFYYIMKDKKDSGFYGAFHSSFSDTGYSGSFSSGGGGGASGGGGGAGGF